MRGAFGAMLVSVVAGQPGPAGTPSSDCQGDAASDGTKCSFDGSSNYHKWTGSYDAGAGKFSGSLLTNSCSQNKYGFCAKCNNGTGFQGRHQHTSKCHYFTFPYSEYAGPRGAPLRGVVGLSIAGVNIYGPMEAGFGIGNEPNPCSHGLRGICAAGIDVPTCESMIEVQCGEPNVMYQLMLDTCGGHAMPYHYHGDLACDYDHTIDGHSPLIGIALDGHGIYGLYEAGGKKKPTLDICGGHVGDTPGHAGAGGEVNTTAGSSIYHYHVSSAPPYTLGCFGPVSSAAQCKTLYPKCSTGYQVLNTTQEPSGVCYDLDCPCFTSGSNAQPSDCGL